MQRLRSLLIDTLILAAVVGGGYYAYQNHNQLLDWYYLRNYTPPASVSALADQSQLTDEGRKLFYRARPQIDSERQSLVQDCHIENDKTIELGCYLSSDKIYLLTISEPNLKTEEPVTAAHETLHAAYDRLNHSEKARVDAMVESAYSNIHDPNLDQRLQDYDQLEPGERLNELHSILGSEYGNLPPDLENYYARYFKDRSVLVADAQQFNSNFDGLHDQVVALDGSIKQLRNRMNQYLAQGDIATYNSLVPVINKQISLYNQYVERYNRYASELLGSESTTATQ